MGIGLCGLVVLRSVSSVSTASPAFVFNTQGVDLNSLARNVDDDAQPPVLSSLGDEIGRQELGDRGGQVDAVDKDVDCPVRQGDICVSVGMSMDSRGTRGSPSSISGKGPPLAVSAMSHLTMFSLQTHPGISVVLSPKIHTPPLTPSNQSS